LEVEEELHRKEALIAKCVVFVPHSAPFLRADLTFAAFADMSRRYAAALMSSRRKCGILTRSTASERCAVLLKHLK
jgi:hypothetical protein